MQPRLTLNSILLLHLSPPLPLSVCLYELNPQLHMMGQNSTSELYPQPKNVNVELRYDFNSFPIGGH